MVNSNAQGTDKINYQMLIRDASGKLLSDSAIGIKFQILKATNTGTVVFEETHNTATNALGVISVKIGGGVTAIGTLTNINWSDDSYFVRVGIDPLGGTNYTLESTKELNTVPLVTSTLKSSMALTADYNSLTNKPVTITAGQIELLGFLTLSNNLDLDILKTAVDVNTERLFPGFGTTTGTAFEILWSKINNNVFYQNGNVGIGTNVNLENSSAVLHVEGGILYETTTSYLTEIGALKYYNIGVPALNDFYFGNNSGTLTLLNSGPDKDIVFRRSDVNILSKLGIGESMVPSYNFDTNNFVLASSTPSINFFDTSYSASFPTADWRIEINDKVDLGENYFSIVNYVTVPASSNSNFKIMAGAPSEAFNILENGNIGINIETPSTKLEVLNTVKALSFVGDISGLTNIPSGSASTSNTGSTTIGADNDSDSNGDVVFKIKNQNQMTIAPNGDIAIGNISPTVALGVDGNLIANDIAAKNLLLSGHILKPIALDTQSLFFNINLDNKSIIILNPTSNSFVQSLQGGIEGQVITFINSSASTLTFVGVSFRIPGGSAVLEKNESITFVKTGNNFITVNLVN